MAGYHTQPHALENEGNDDSKSSDESQEMDSDHDQTRAGNVSWSTCKEVG